MKTNENGFSLVELVASMAILMIVGVAIIGFSTFCFRQYTKSSEETTVQMETQTVQNQLQDMILQTNVGIALNSQKINGETKEGRKLSLYNRDDAGEPLRIRISMDYGKNVLYYQEYGLDKDLVRQERMGHAISNDEAWCIEKTSKQVLASNVEDWKVTLWDEDGNEITNTSNEITPTPTKAMIWLKIKVNDSEYETTQTVLIRNQIYSSDKKSRYVLAEE